MKLFLRILLVISILATMAFIFYNSTLPPEQSSVQSGIIGDIIAGIIPPETTVGSFIQTYLRKIAHFTEFGLLGIEVMLFILLLDNKRPVHFIRSFYLAVTVALTDESIQIFTGRGPQVEDVLVDVGGYLVFSLLALIFVGLILILKAIFKPKY